MERKERGSRSGGVSALAANTQTMGEALTADQVAGAEGPVDCFPRRSTCLPFATLVEAILDRCEKGLAAMDAAEFAEPVHPPNPSFAKALSAHDISSMLAKSPNPDTGRASK